MPYAVCAFSRFKFLSLHTRGLRMENFKSQLALGGTTNRINQLAHVSLLDGRDNTSIGLNTEYARGANNVVLGAYAGTSADDACKNMVIIGSRCAQQLHNSTFSVAVGTSAASLAQAMHYSVLLGSDAGRYTRGSFHCTAVGYAAGAYMVGGLRNTFVGAHSGMYALDTSDNTFVGESAGVGCRQGAMNVAVGAGSAQGKVGSNNVVVGFQAAGNVAVCDDTVAVGTLAGQQAIASSKNVFVGGSAGQYASNATLCTFVGYGTGANCSNSAMNVSVGALSGQGSNVGSNNVVLGFQAAGHVGIMSDTVAVGASAGYSTSGTNNVWVGSQTGSQAANASRVVAVGYAAASDAHGTSNTVFVGASAGSNANGSSDSVSVGDLAGLNANGSHNVWVGSQAGAYASSASSMVAIGYLAAQNANGSSSVAIGYQAATSTTGSQNVWVGSQAGASATNTSNSVAIGYGAGQLSGGDNNTLVGAEAGTNFVGSYNTVVGSLAGQFPDPNIDNNTLVGACAGTYITGSQNTIVGAQAGTDVWQNSVVVGYGAVGAGAGASGSVVVGTLALNGGSGAVDSVVVGSSISAFYAAESTVVGTSINCQGVVQSSTVIGFNITSSDLSHSVVLGSQVELDEADSNKCIIGIGNMNKRALELATTNTQVGYGAGAGMQGSQNTIVGVDIGNSITANNSVILGAAGLSHYTVQDSVIIGSGNFTTTEAIALTDCVVLGQRCSALTGLQDVIAIGSELSLSTDDNQSCLIGFGGARALTASSTTQYFGPSTRPNFQAIQQGNALVNSSQVIFPASGYIVTRSLAYVNGEQHAMYNALGSGTAAGSGTGAVLNFSPYGSDLASRLPEEASWYTTASIYVPNPSGNSATTFTPAYTASLNIEYTHLYAGPDLNAKANIVGMILSPQTWSGRSYSSFSLELWLCTDGNTPQEGPLVGSMNAPLEDATSVDNVDWSLGLTKYEPVNNALTTTNTTYLTFEYATNIINTRIRLVGNTTPLEHGSWYHLAVIGDYANNSQVSLYVNGVIQELYVKKVATSIDVNLQYPFDSVHITSLGDSDVAPPLYHTPAASQYSTQGLRWVGYGVRLGRIDSNGQDGYLPQVRGGFVAEVYLSIPRTTDANCANTIGGFPCPSKARGMPRALSQYQNGSLSNTNGMTMWINAVSETPVMSYQTFTSRLFGVEAQQLDIRPTYQQIFGQDTPFLGTPTPSMQPGASLTVHYGGRITMYDMPIFLNAEGSMGLCSTRNTGFGPDRSIASPGVFLWGPSGTLGCATANIYGYDNGYGLLGWDSSTVTAYRDFAVQANTGTTIFGVNQQGLYCETNASVGGALAVGGSVSAYGDASVHGSLRVGSLFVAGVPVTGGSGGGGGGGGTTSQTSVSTTDLLVANLNANASVIMRTSANGTFDAPANSHSISIQNAILGGSDFNNIMGTLIVSATNQFSNTHAKLGHGTMSVLMATGSSEMDIMPVSMHSSLNLSKFTVGKTSDNGNIVIQTDSDCSITWQFYGSAFSTTGPSSNVTPYTSLAGVDILAYNIVAKTLFVGNLAAPSSIIVRACPNGSFDLAANAHYISVVNDILTGSAYNNLTGTLYVSVTNQFSNAHVKVAQGMLSVMKAAGSAEMDIMPLAMHLSANTSTFTVGKTADNGSVVINTDADCSISWQFFGSGF